MEPYDRIKFILWTSVLDSSDDDCWCYNHHRRRHLCTQVQILSALNLSGVTLKLRTIEFFVIVDHWTISHSNFVGMFMIAIANVTFLAPTNHQLLPSNRKLTTDIMQPLCCCFVCNKTLHEKNCIFFQALLPYSISDPPHWVGLGLLPPHKFVGQSYCYYWL
jgi:hypothetical protein